MRRFKKYIYIAIVLLILLSCDQTTKSRENHDFDSFIANTDKSGWINQDYVMGKFEPSDHKAFIIIDEEYTNRQGLYLRTEAYEAFVQMWEAAKKEDITLSIRSATRNFDYQKGIWERKWTGQTELSDGTKASDIKDKKSRAMKILLYSSMPGTSRHHWGTDIDLNSFSNSYFEEGRGLTLYTWLQKNAAIYGYCQPYTSKSTGRTGYEEEKWHWSYLPLALPLTRYCDATLDNEMIVGFKGADVAGQIDVLNNYILGINKNCL